MKLTDEQRKARFDRLPKWARDEMSVLAMRLRESRDELRQLTSMAQPDSEMFYRSYSYENSVLPERIELPHGMLQVSLGRDRWNREHVINVTRGLSTTGAPSVEIRGDQGPLRIIPQVSNAVFITTLDPNKDD